MNANDPATTTKHLARREVQLCVAVFINLQPRLAQAAPGLAGQWGQKAGSALGGQTHPPWDQVQTLTSQSLYNSAPGQRGKCEGVGGNKRYFFDLRKGRIPGTSKTCLVTTHPAFKSASLGTCPPPLKSTDARDLRNWKHSITDSGNNPIYTLFAESSFGSRKGEQFVRSLQSNSEAIYFQPGLRGILVPSLGLRYWLAQNSYCEFSCPCLHLWQQQLAGGDPQTSTQILLASPSR